MKIEFIEINSDDFDEEERALLEEAMSDIDVRDVLTLQTIDEIKVELGLVTVQ
jgi:hypothetical protein